MSISRNALVTAVMAFSSMATAGSAADLAADVASKLRDSGALAGYRVNVRSKSGTVWLEGRVADETQLAAALGIAEATPGVERVVNRLAIDDGSRDGEPPRAVPMAVEGAADEQSPADPPAAANSLVAIATRLMSPGAPRPRATNPDVQLVQATGPSRPARQASPRGMVSRPASPMPIGTPTARPMNPNSRARTAVRTSGMGEPMTLPAPGGYDGPLVDGQMVPGTMQYSEGYAPGAGDGSGGVVGMPGGAGMGAAPMAMGGTGVGMPPVPSRGGGPNMPNYAWPSYAAYPNYAALQYPTQYSPTAWPYIGPFYPYPQVPLGWRRVSLEWDDGWWWLDFDERHIHSHHR